MFYYFSRYSDCQYADRLCIYKLLHHRHTLEYNCITATPITTAITSIFRAWHSVVLISVRALSALMSLNCPDQSHLGLPPTHSLPMVPEVYLSSGQGPHFCYIVAVLLLNGSEICFIIFVYLSLLIDPVAIASPAQVVWYLTPACGIAALPMLMLPLAPDLPFLMEQPCSCWSLTISIHLSFQL